MKAAMPMLLLSVLAAQTFEVASVKPVSPDRGGGRIVVGMTGREGGPGTSDPTRVRYAVIDMRFLISEAYGERGMKIGGPGWMDEVDARMPSGASAEQFRVIFQHKGRYDFTQLDPTKAGEARLAIEHVEKVPTENGGQP